MAVLSERIPFKFWGTIAWGDFADFTFYRGHQCQIIVFAKTWPDKPPSDNQIQWRTLYTAAVDAWNALTNAAREQWHLATRRASLTMHGFNLWMHWQLTGDDSAIATLERQTRTNLLPP